MDEKFCSRSIYSNIGTI